MLFISVGPQSTQILFIKRPRCCGLGVWVGLSCGLGEVKIWTDSGCLERQLYMVTFNLSVQIVITEIGNDDKYYRFGAKGKIQEEKVIMMESKLSN